MRIFEHIFPGRDLVFIAEIGLNHLGNADIAGRMIKEASKAGADAVKFQTFVPELMYSTYASSLLRFGIEKEADPGKIDFFKKFVIEKDEYHTLAALAGGLGLVFFSSPFDVDSVNLLEDLGVRLYKVASSELTNHILLKRIAETKKPVIMSTGMSTEDEISMAVELLRDNGTPDIVLMHCVSLYPLPLGMTNLKRIVNLRKRFNLHVGFSDHTSGSRAAYAAAALGARIFEKHLTLDREIDCPDREVSLTPCEFKQMRESVELTLKMIGDGHISYDSSEEETALQSRKSLFAGRFIPKGKALEADDVIAKRPGVGIPIYRLHEIIGKKTNREITEDFALREEYFE